MRYYRLLDPKHKGTIVRGAGKIQEQFFPGKGWLRSGILLHYFSPESDTYDMYEEISEADALASI
jgi:hypothetical protein